MIIRLTDEASAELRSVYLRYPAQDARESELIESLLYHMSSGSNVNLDISEGYLTIQQQGWKK